MHAYGERHSSPVLRLASIWSIYMRTVDRFSHISSSNARTCLLHRTFHVFVCGTYLDHAVFL